MSEFDFDVAVLGGGSGGYAAGRTAAGAGLKTVVIEGGKEVGGLCILRGCMPTKALLYAADVIHLARHAGTWGVQAPQVGFDFEQVMARKNAMVKDFADGRVQQLTSGRFKFIRATARFTDTHTVGLSTGDTLTAGYFIISTGSVVSEPPLPSLRNVGYLTSDEALRLAGPPKSLIVLGGGAVGVEFAQFFARFDTQVTLIQRSPHILRDFDTDAAAELEKVFRREGMTVVTDTRLLDAGRDGGLKVVSFERDGKTETASADEILFALGRTPNTAHLHLEKAGVETDRGRIVTNERMQTSAQHIYAAGDCTGPHEIVHIAIQQGERRPQRVRANFSAQHRLPAAHACCVHRSANWPRGADREASESEERALPCRELPVQRSRQVADHGREGRLRETAGESGDRRNHRRLLCRPDGR